MLVLDTASAYLLLTTTTIAMKPPTDGTHTTIPVGVIEGRMFANLMRPLAPAVPTRKVFGGETRALGIQGFVNPGFLTISGGQAPATGVTYAAAATLPLGITSLACDAGIRVTVTTEVNADGTNDLVLDMTATAAGNVRVGFDYAAGFDNPGDLIDLYAEATLIGGYSNFRGGYLDCQYSHGAGPTVEGWSDCFNDGGKVLIDAVNLPAGIDQGVMPATVYDEVLNFYVPMTVGLADPRASFTPRLYNFFGGAGSAKMKWRHFATDKRLA